MFGPVFNGRGAHGDERWARMLLNPLDMRFAEVYGMVNIRNDGRPDTFDGRRIAHRRHF